MSEPGSILTWTTTAWAIPDHPPAGHAPRLVPSIASAPVKTNRYSSVHRPDARATKPATTAAGVNAPDKVGGVGVDTVTDARRAEAFPDRAECHRQRGQPYLGARRYGSDTDSGSG